jgi:hypothetical protein
MDEVVHPGTQDRSNLIEVDHLTENLRDPGKLSHVSGVAVGNDDDLRELELAKGGPNHAQLPAPDRIEAQDDDSDVRGLDVLWEGESLRCQHLEPLQATQYLGPR